MMLTHFFKIFTQKLLLNFGREPCKHALKEPNKYSLC